MPPHRRPLLHPPAQGIPTTRAGSLVTSDLRVERDPLYDGNSIMVGLCLHPALPCSPLSRPVKSRLLAPTSSCSGAMCDRFSNCSNIPPLWFF